MQSLAQRLLTLEVNSPGATDPTTHQVVRICEKLGISLIRFAGPDGFTALLRRALALARSDVPALQSVKVSIDGRLEGLEGTAVGAENVGIEAAVAIIAHLLGLLAAFIGEPLTVRLVREGWPNISVDNNL